MSPTPSVRAMGFARLILLFHAPGLSGHNMHMASPISYRPTLVGIDISNELI